MLIEDLDKLEKARDKISQVINKTEEITFTLQSIENKNSQKRT